ncbi:MAG: hypothetical protein PHX83_07090 [Acidobacteriia bacterium]|nr:hypothetical protein [Terriglobia bacterium]
MPTEYTSIIDEGGTFKDYVMRCARGIEYLFRMHDDSMDAKIPEEFKPEEYHKNEAEKCRTRLTELLETSTQDAVGEARREFNKSVKCMQEYRDEHAKVKFAYDSMREQVQAWNPPTPEHEDLKTFMLSQIETGKPLDYDYPAPVLLTGEQWLTNETKHVAKDLTYHEAEYRKEVGRCIKATAYLKALRGSLETMR